jgi:hypothetical protein
MTMFTIIAEDKDDNTPFNPLNSLMSLVIFPPKFTKGHLNASFQSADLKSSTIYKSASINPFQYAPQNNCKLVQVAANKIKEERNKIKWRTVEKDRKQNSSLIEGVGRINLMEDVAMTCANICGMQIAIVDVLSVKPLLYQFANKLIKFIKIKKTKTWMRDNIDSLVHLPMVFMAKLYKFFQHLVLFSQNLINTNKIELAYTNLDSKNVTIAVKLVLKFLNKMQEHINNNLIPKDVPTFTKRFFTESTGCGFILVAKNDESKKMNATQPTALSVSGNGKCKSNSKEEEGKEKPRKEFSDKSLKMGLFHLKKGTPAAKALPHKSTLKDGVSVCLEFCCHKMKCNMPHQLCKDRKNYTNWKNVPSDNKVILLKHMDSTGLMWLNAETFEKHKIAIAPECIHLLGDANGPKQKKVRDLSRWIDHILLACATK